MAIKNNKFFKKPHIKKLKVAGLTFGFKYKVAENYPNTSAAMSLVAKAENTDNIARKKGIDNYQISFDKLMDAFDAFIRENSNNRLTAGNERNYDLTNPCELTIRLLWEIRHTYKHSGSTVDKKCKNTYEKIKTKYKSTVPIINLPETIEIGLSFTLEDDDYRKVKKCIFKYIKHRIKQNEYKILYSRSCITDHTICQMAVFLPIGKKILIFDYIKAYEHGCRLEGMTFNPAPDSTYCQGKICFQDGSQIPGVIISRQEYDAIIRNPSLLDDVGI